MNSAIMSTTKLSWDRHAGGKVDTDHIFNRVLK